jgi:hypothetical protein
MAPTDAKIEKSPGAAGLSNHSLSSKDGEKPQLMNIEDVEATTSPEVQHAKVVERLSRLPRKRKKLSSGSSTGI